MPRTKRDPGETGWAHIILRGINRENLFYDEVDFSQFIKTTERYLKDCDLKYSVICLMSNHVHMLLWEQNGTFSEAMKKITVSYAQYYNKKLDRVGPVFQDRYRSEAINDAQYFLTATRYIWQNPLKACICPAEEDRYTLLNKNSLIPDYFQDEAVLMAWLQEPNSDACMEYFSVPHYSDTEVIALLKQLTGDANPQFIQGMDKKQRNEILQLLKEDGVPVRKLSRLTGLNRNVIQRA